MGDKWQSVFADVQAQPDWKSRDVRPLEPDEIGAEVNQGKV